MITVIERLLLLCVKHYGILLLLLVLLSMVLVVMKRRCGGRFIGVNCIDAKHLIVALIAGGRQNDWIV